ncbi:SUMF1/EgtB/PvdO family nonheme iron enzyme [Nannocystis punicea]|uniref:SUMF1/EgtB/PvdO family nonheme iron enzyme n=1 Tax=Nannocystis punicea TaxID=2995304 RepID=A0ABY7H8D8_9BACT|nr:SUMF1/EgtB/PvdO family nonheme iron enzyme [Nannocystis poenicansa]WAS95528.1 SUMF1/EgtB/PvdO family nonheme iron enzyme [Nannocystis poenicansa]
MTLSHRFPVLLCYLALSACQATVNLGPLSGTDGMDTSDSSTADPPGTTGMTDLTTEGPSSSDPGTTTGPDPSGTETSETSTGDPGETTASDTGSASEGTSTTDTTTGDTTTDTITSGTTGGVDPGCGDVPADMACVPANTFEMGTNLAMFGGWQTDPTEKPAHTVTITKSYWIDLTEVTVEDYSVCWALKVCELPMQGPNLNWGVAGKEKHPANGINWYQAKKYCEWKGKRLPTEAEWELAARGDDGRMYPWGDEPPTCDHVASNDCGTTGTVAVGSKPLGDSPYGLHDMGGNVVEWCADYYKEDYYYQSPAVDPMGPVDGTRRSARSFGTFVYAPGPASRATLRSGASPLLQDINPAVAGFRCAQTAP